jgi:signal transduction histidine kinase/ActR/RegA family two-component response regulator
MATPYPRSSRDNQHGDDVDTVSTSESAPALRLAPAPAPAPVPLGGTHQPPSPADDEVKIGEHIELLSHQTISLNRSKLREHSASTSQNHLKRNDAVTVKLYNTDHDQSETDGSAASATRCCSFRTKSHSKAASPYCVHAQALCFHRSCVLEVIAIVVCSMLVAFAVHANETSKDTWYHEKIHESSELVSRALQSRLDSFISLEQFMATTLTTYSVTTMDQFIALTQQLTDRAEVQSMVLTDYVHNEDRVSYEQQQIVPVFNNSKFGYIDQICSFDGNNIRAPRSVSPVYSDYFVCKYASPLEALYVLGGRDLFRNNDIEGLNAKVAIQTDSPQMAEPFVVPDNNAENSVIRGVFFPVRPNNTSGTSSSPRANVTTQVLYSTFLMSEMVSSSVSALHLPNLWISVCDSSTADNDAIVFRGFTDSDGELFSHYQYSNAKLVPSAENRAACRVAHSDYARSLSFPVLQRTWTVVIARGPGFEDSYPVSSDYELFLYLCIGGAVAIGVYVLFNAAHLRKKVVQNKSLLIEAQDANEAKRTFIAFLCHELRNPLHAIVSSVEELRECDVEKDIVNSLDIGSKTMLSITNDILDMSRIEVGTFEVTVGCINIKHVLQNSVDSHMAWADEGNTQLVLHIGNDVPEWIMADQVRITQILNNLLSNAIKFSKANGSVVLHARIVQQNDNECSNAIFLGQQQQQPGLAVATQQGVSGLDTAIDISPNVDAADHGAIEMANMREDHQHCHNAILSLSVTDSGIGMTEHELVTVFQPYKQLESGKHSSNKPQKRAGTGIGLTIVGTMVAALGGDILVSSQKNVGTRFDALFPLVVPSHQELQQHLQPALGEVELAVGLNTIESEDGKSQSPARRTVLAVDDESINRKIMRRMLQRLRPDLTILEATNGTEALQIMQQQPEDIAVVLMDLNMPVMDGIESCKCIRKLSGQAGVVPIIAVTANVLTSQREQCMDAGMHDILAKPFRKADLKRMLTLYAPESEF